MENSNFGYEDNDSSIEIFSKEAIDGMNFEECLEYEEEIRKYCISWIHDFMDEDEDYEENTCFSKSFDYDSGVFYFDYDNGRYTLSLFNGCFATSISMSEEEYTLENCIYRYYNSGFGPLEKNFFTNENKIVLKNASTLLNEFIDYFYNED